MTKGVQIQNAARVKDPGDFGPGTSYVVNAFVGWGGGLATLGTLSP